MIKEKKDDDALSNQEKPVANTCMLVLNSSNFRKDNYTECTMHEKIAYSQLLAIGGTKRYHTQTK